MTKVGYDQNDACGKLRKILGLGSPRLIVFLGRFWYRISAAMYTFTRHPPSGSYVRLYGSEPQNSLTPLRLYYESSVRGTIKAHLTN